MKEIEIYKKTIDKYGKSKQVVKAVEELSELQKELCKLLLTVTNKRKVVTNVAEEIADCEIMIKQLKLILNCDGMVNNWKLYKLKRLEEKLNN